MAELSATVSNNRESDDSGSDIPVGIYDESTEPTPGSAGTPGTSRRKHTKVRDGTQAFIPYNILQSPKLVSLATRMKMTPTQQAAFTEAFIEEVGRDVSKVSTSY
eukprot:GHVU01080579.1.p2 GENE.GHVU01080579.1~~GHVU01080579.1.p2  ORF type:complete len:105 (+),score=9.56 GHVU01080579.1:160-474(+)